MKKIVMILTAVSILALPVFATGSQSRTQVPSGPMEISVAFFWNYSEVNFEADRFGRFVNDKFNVKINPVIFDWTNFNDRIMLWAAANDLPDTWAGSPPAAHWFPTFIQQGLIRSIPYNMISKYPNIKSLTDDSVLSNQLRDLYGEYYFIRREDYNYTLASSVYQGIYYRRDWAERLGFRETPTDMETLYQMMRAFVYNDPDGNGRRDTYGFTFHSWNLFFFMNPFGAFPDQWINGSGGRAVPGWTDEEPMVQGLTWLQRAYNEGLIDQEFPSDWNIVVQKFVGGTFGGMIRTVSPSAINTQAVQQFGSAHPEAGDPLRAVGLIGGLSARPGALPYRGVISDDSGSVFSADVSDAKLDKILEIVDYFYTDEGVNLISWGFRDEDYRVNADGSFTSLMTQPMRTKYPAAGIAHYANWNNSFSFIDPAFPPEVRSLALDALTSFGQAAANARPLTNELANYITTEERSLFSFDIYRNMIEVITGTDDVRTRYREFMADANNRGLQRMIDSVNNAMRRR